MHKYKVYVVFSSPQFVPLNSGTTKECTFSIDTVNWMYSLNMRHPGPGVPVKWGCFSMNYWFVVKSGKSWKNAAQIAANVLKKRNPKAILSVNIVEK